MKRTLTILMAAGLVVMMPATALAQVAPGPGLPPLDAQPLDDHECGGVVDVGCRPDCSTPEDCFVICAVFVNLTRVLSNVQLIGDLDVEGNPEIRDPAASDTDCVRY